MTDHNENAASKHLKRRVWKWISRSIQFAVLLAIVLAAIPVIRISTARPGTSPVFADQLRAIGESRATADPGEVGQFELLRQATQTPDAILATIGVEYERVYTERFGHLYLEGGVSPRYLSEPAVDPEYYGKFEPQYAVVPEFNAFVHEYSVRASDALEQSRLSAILDQLADAPLDARPIQPGPLMFAWHDDLVRTNYLVSWLRGRMQLCAERGDWEGFERTLHRRRSVSRLLRGDTREMSLLTSNSIARGNAILTADAAVTYDIPPAVLRSLITVFNNDPIKPDLNHAIEIERLILLDYVEHTYSNNGRGDGYRLPRSALELGSTGLPSQSSIDNIPGLLMPSRKDAIHAVDGFVLDMKALRGSPRKNRRDKHQWHYMTIWGESLFDSRPILITPSLLYWADDSLSALNAARLILAVELHRAEHGRPPSALADLTPTYFSEIPPDPLAGNGSFLYTTDPTLPHGYRFYSVGENGVDEGGNNDSGDDDLYAPIVMD